MVESFLWTKNSLKAVEVDIWITSLALKCLNKNLISLNSQFKKANKENVCKDKIYFERCEIITAVSISAATTVTADGTGITWAADIADSNGVVTDILKI